MTTNVIIKDLVKSILKGGEEVKEFSRNLLCKSIVSAVDAPIFYSLPFEEISRVVQKIDFFNDDEIKEPTLTLQTLFENASKFYGRDAVLLLNDIKSDDPPQLTHDDIINIVCKFSNCYLLTKLSELYTYDKSLLHLVDTEALEKYEKSNRELQEENTHLKKRIKELEEINKTYEEKLPKSSSAKTTASNEPKESKAAKPSEPKVIKQPKETKENKPKPKSELIKAFEYKRIEFQPVKKKPKYYEKDIFYACEKGYLESVQYLCEKLFSQKNATDFLKRTPLHHACEYGQLRIVQYLCEIQKVNKEATDENGYTPLHCACWNGHLPVVKYLCEVQKVNKEVTNKIRLTPYAIAKSENKKEIIKYFESIGVHK